MRLGPEIGGVIDQDVVGEHVGEWTAGIIGHVGRRQRRDVVDCQCMVHKEGRGWSAFHTLRLSEDITSFSSCCRGVCGLGRALDTD